MPYPYSSSSTTATASSSSLPGDVNTSKRRSPRGLFVSPALELPPKKLVRPLVVLPKSDSDKMPAVTTTKARKRSSSIASLVQFGSPIDNSVASLARADSLSSMYTTDSYVSSAFSVAFPSSSPGTSTSSLGHGISNLEKTEVPSLFASISSIRQGGRSPSPSPGPNPGAANSNVSRALPYVPAPIPAPSAIRGDDSAHVFIPVLNQTTVVEAQESEGEDEYDIISSYALAERRRRETQHVASVYRGKSKSPRPLPVTPPPPLPAMSADSTGTEEGPESPVMPVFAAVDTGRRRLDRNQSEFKHPRPAPSPAPSPPLPPLVPVRKPDPAPVPVKAASVLVPTAKKAAPPASMMTFALATHRPKPKTKTMPKEQWTKQVQARARPRANSEPETPTPLKERFGVDDLPRVGKGGGAGFGWKFNFLPPTREDSLRPALKIDADTPASSALPDTKTTTPYTPLSADPFASSCITIAKDRPFAEYHTQIRPHIEVKPIARRHSIDSPASCTSPGSVYSNDDDEEAYGGVSMLSVRGRERRHGWSGAWNAEDVDVGEAVRGLRGM